MQNPDRDTEWTGTPEEADHHGILTQPLDCELFLSGRDQARFSVADRVYLGHPDFDVRREHQLLEETLDPIRYGTLLFESLFPKGDDLRDGYRESLALARHRGQSLRFRLHSGQSPQRHFHDWP